jgi:N-methylhydantoinase A/oxoprolinase/acetone carboxylase beta subunit
MKLGIDVGQTFTDAVIVDQGGRFLGKTKQMTTDDCMVGIRSAAKQVFADTNVVPQDIKGIFIGGTYSYALQSGVDLARTALIRIMRSPSVIKPTMDMPQKFPAHVHKTYQIYGGRHFDGTRYGSPQSLRKQLAPILEEMAESEIEAVALISTFSPLFTEEERQVEQYIRESLPHLHVTMSHTLQSIGFIERENTALMNALLAKVLRKALHGLEVEFKKLDFVLAGSDVPSRTDLRLRCYELLARRSSVV